jgi:hypothetical protein
MPAKSLWKQLMVNLPWPNFPTCFPCWNWNWKVDTIIYNQSNVMAELGTLTEDEFCMCLHNFSEYHKCILSAGDFLEVYD